MKLNDLDLINYDSKYQEAFFTFAINVTYSDVAALNGELLTVKEGNDVLAAFGSYNLMAIEKRGSFLYARFMKALEPNTEQSINALDVTCATLARQATDQTTVNTDLQDQIDLQGAAIEELIMLTLGDE